MESLADTREKCSGAKVAIDKGKGKELVKKETGMDVLSLVKLDVIDGKVVIESTIED